MPTRGRPAKPIVLGMDGGIYIAPELARQLGAPQAAPAPRPPTLSMSEQQWKLLELLAQGLPNKTIARRMGIASSTVKNQLTVVFGKLGVANRTQAAIAARALLKSKGAGA